jgi:hypothetical protein
MTANSSLSEGELRKIITQQVLHGLTSPVPPLTRRDVRVPGVPRKVISVIGMRRTGKSTFLWQVLGDRLAAGVGREGLLYFSFDDERLGGMTLADLSIVLEEYYRLHPEWRDRRRATLFLDEIQLVEGWERFVRRILDSEKVDVFVSGSSARLLSREVATSLRGRAMEALVHPFSFREFLRHVGREPDHPLDRLVKAARSALAHDLETYLREGGFPEAIGADVRDRSDLLGGFVDVTLLRDILERHSVGQPQVVRWMTRQLLGNAAGLFSINKFFNDLKSAGVRIAKDTLHDYLGYLEDAFLVRTLSIATDSERRRMVNPRKVYPIDPGLIPLFDRSGRANLGHALETCVALELERRGAQLSYLRTKDGYEVDFLAWYPGQGSELIQVCTAVDSSATLEREVRALQAAAIEHPRASLHLVVLHQPMRAAVPSKIHVHSAVEWLLGSASDRKGQVRK